MTIIQHNFSNGLRLIYQQVNSPVKLSAISLFCRVGSNNEPDQLNGVSHLIEHMMFKGTTNIEDTKGIAKIFDSIGAYFNAFTDKNLTCYTVKTDSSHLPIVIETLSDMVCNSKFEKTEFEKEKQVVIEEIIRAEDDTSHHINNEIFKLVFKGDRLANSVGSIPEIISKYNYEEAFKFMKTFYKPSNMVFSICTNIDFDKIKSLIEKSFLVTKPYEPFLENPTYKYTNSIEDQKNIRLDTIDRELEQTHIAMAFRTVDLYDQDKYILDLIQVILAGNMSSRLFINLREKRGLTYNVSIDDSSYESSGLFCILTSVDKDKLLNHKDSSNQQMKDGAIKVIIDTLNEILYNGITEEELDKAKGYLKGSLNLGYEDTLNISDYNGRIIILDRAHFIPITALYDVRYSYIKVDDIHRTIRKYFKPNMINLYLIGKNVSKLTDKVTLELKKMMSVSEDEPIVRLSQSPPPILEESPPPLSDQISLESSESPPPQDSQVEPNVNNVLKDTQEPESPPPQYSQVEPSVNNVIKDTQVPESPPPQDSQVEPSVNNVIKDTKEPESPPPQDSQVESSLNNTLKDTQVPESPPPLSNNIFDPDKTARELVNNVRNNNI